MSIISSIDFSCNYRVKSLSFFTYLLLTLINLSNCWWDTGHMLVAKIAEIDLLNKSKNKIF